MFTHTSDSTQIGLSVLVSEQECMCEHTVDSKSSEIIVLDNIDLIFLYCKSSKSSAPDND